MKIENNKLKIEVNNLKAKLLQTEPDDKLFTKRRQDILYRLNTKKDNVKFETIEKYKIVLDESSKLYQ